MGLRNCILLFILALSPQVLIGISPKLRVFKGHLAADGEFPFMAAVFTNSKFRCGGTIIDENWILTAAHCAVVNNETTQTTTKQNADELHVLTGTNNIEDPDVTKQSKVSEIILHEGYRPFIRRDFVNDIALLRLEKPLTFNSLTQTVKLESTKHDAKPNTTVKIVGWGLTEVPVDPKNPGNGSKHLKKATVQIFSNGDCTMRTGYSISHKQICAGSDAEGFSQCNGDSGGPFVKVRGTTVYQVGVMSFSDGPCKVPGVSTRVTQFIDWIQDKTGGKAQIYSH